MKDLDSPAPTPTGDAPATDTDDLWEQYDAHLECKPSPRRAADIQAEWLDKLFTLRERIEDGPVPAPAVAPPTFTPSLEHAESMATNNPTSAAPAVAVPREDEIVSLNSWEPPERHDSGTYGELPDVVRGMLEGHRWDNWTRDEQRAWLIAALSTERAAKDALKQSCDEWIKRWTEDTAAWTDSYNGERRRAEALREAMQYVWDALDNHDYAEAMRKADLWRVERPEADAVDRPAGDTP